ncbi:MAG: gas vesicle protein K, partial [bacterium]|nr:gas vesicle protein K [bacterium]
MRRDRVLAGDPARLPEAKFPEPRAARPLRVEADAEQLERGLARLVLAILELVRELLERPAVRRGEGG